jgi:hypothetical protein
MSVCCECCVLSGRGLCDGMITRPEESYRLWCVAVCDIVTSSMRSQTSIHCDWSTRSPRWSGPHHDSLQVRLPGSTLAYRKLLTVIAD